MNEDDDEIEYIDYEVFMEILLADDDLDEKSNKEYVNRKILKMTGKDINEN